MVKNPPANAGDTGSILGLGRSPEEGSILELGRSPGEENGNPTPSSILAWDIPWTEDHGGLQSMGSQKELDMTWQLNNNKHVKR